VLLPIALALSGMAAAQTAWPERPIQLIVPFPAGGGVDVVARPFAQIFGELLHQSVVVMSRDGASWRRTTRPRATW
jgi:tripartite-type tricarboxylate transporter receptor subunit TctC